MENYDKDRERLYKSITKLSTNKLKFYKLMESLHKLNAAYHLALVEVRRHPRPYAEAVVKARLDEYKNLLECIERELTLAILFRVDC